MTEYENVREQYTFNTGRLMNLLKRKEFLDKSLDRLDASTRDAEEVKKEKINILKDITELCQELQNISSSIKYASNRALFVLENDID